MVRVLSVVRSNRAPERFEPIPRAILVRTESLVVLRVFSEMFFENSDVNAITAFGDCTIYCLTISTWCAKK